MGKQNKPKANGQNKGTLKATPYSKPKVEVRFEKDGKINKPSKSRPAEHPSKDKGKGKALTPAEPALVTESVHSTTTLKSTAAPSILPSLPSSSSFMIIAGSYEKLLYGIEGSYPSSSTSQPASKADDEEDVIKPDVKPVFIFPAHLACVKAVAASPGGKWLATGSEDEFVKVWDLRRRKEVGSLSQHTGSITSLHFPTAAHLITTSVDGTLCLFRTSDWAVLKTLKGHSGRVNHVDVHPTGRVALSVGKDMTLRMWDLMRGRGAASLPLGSEAEQVKFSPKGTHFAVLFPKKVEIYSLTLKKLCTLETKSRYNAVEFAVLPSGLGEDGDDEDEDEDEEVEDKEVLCVGTEKGVVEVYEVEIGDAEEEEDEEEDAELDEEEEGTGKDKGSGADLIKIGELVGHTNRIKSISSLPFLKPSTLEKGSLEPTVLLSTCSSDGFIRVYDLGEMVAKFGVEEVREEAVASYDTKGSRLTCVFLADGKAVKGRVGVPNLGVENAKDGVEGGEKDEEEVGSDEEDDEDIYGSGGEDEDVPDEMEVGFEDEEEEEEGEEEDEGE